MMQKLDIVIAIIVVLGGLSCFYAGFTRSVWGLIAVSAGVFAANQLWPKLAPIIHRFIDHHAAAKWASIILIAVGVSILIDALFERLQDIMAKGVLGWVNSSVGAAFGIVASTILVACFLLLLSQYGGDSIQETITTSRFGPRLLEIGHEVFDFGREVVREQIGRV